MSVMGFLGEFWSWSTKLYYKKPYPLTLFLAKVLINVSTFYLLLELRDLNREQVLQELPLICRE